MISKASELLELFIKEETKKLAGIKMPHMPTLGSAYEEVTKQGIDQNFAIPKHLDLSVVSGFVSIGGEMLPEQIDCMLVHGQGERYGLTEQYIYDVEHILCIFEVKKTLKKADYIDAMDHLASIRRRFAEHFEYKLINEGYEPDITAARRHFSQITGKVAPEYYSGIHELSESDGILFYCLVQESLAPASIIHGYDGYKTESGLRKAFIDILKEKKNETGVGFGIPSIPSLVTSNQHCLVKGNGIPFLAIKDNNEWIAVFSTRHNSAKLILELIWSKISCQFDIKMPWDDGLHMDNIEPLLVAKAVRVEDKAGWMYNPIEFKEERLKRDDNHVWEPAIIGKAEMSAINIMAMRGGYLPLDKGMNEYLITEHQATMDEVSQNLILTRLFMKDGEYIRPIHNVTHIATLDDDTGYASSERDRFDLWCEQNGVAPNYLNIVFLE
ncbi:MAG: hypothetical protein Q7T36_14295 [Fluviicoccus sp.]|uniref:DUF6602 domain-containing protein n=1 Tax=Fluviicoccus sp. TaxID=2003552 RepID=UPI00271F5372|nr:DUF6602 domain-containing protein [Fluviicoccus sp.]MDO8331632.1 hypothetical protein [Fluviicoccus sp.]